MYSPFKSLQNKVFAQLYLAQTISLIGDALTWVALALLAFEIGGIEGSAKLLSIALFMRVLIFVLVSPYAGVLADRISRKSILVFTHLCRMLIVGIFPFITQEWHIYILVGSLNFFNAFFTPTYKATIPQIITDKVLYGQAISLSSATYQLLGVFGPGLAGIAAAWLGARQIFFIDSATFLIAAIFIIYLPNTLKVGNFTQPPKTKIWQSIMIGTSLLFNKRQVRFGLLMQLVVSIIGAQILVNTVGYVRGSLERSEQHYGWVMGAMGLGATLGALVVGFVQQRFKLKTLILVGTIIACLAILMGNYLELGLLMFCWSVAGLGQSLVNIPTETLIAREIDTINQGKVYGAHFAWSHLWWAISYPVAGWLGESFSHQNFTIASLIAIGMLGLMILVHNWENPDQLT